MTTTDPSADNRLPADRLKAFQEALEILYIKDNISGRLLFLKEWPAAALHIFGEELCRFDREGAKDRERRAALELEADERRVGLLELAVSFEEKSVVKGSLQADYVREIITGLGRETALYLYAVWIVDKFLPRPPGAEPVAKKEENRPTKSAPPLPAAKPEFFDDPADAIQPISVESPKGGLKITGITDKKE